MAEQHIVKLRMMAITGTAAVEALEANIEAVWIVLSREATIRGGPDGIEDCEE